MNRATVREVRVGLLVALALAGVFVLLGLAAGGPGFLAPRRTIDVVFRDGQGLRVGTPVRIAGIDAGRVAAVDLAEVEGKLRARVRLSLPADVLGRIKVDDKITIKASLTGQSHVEISSAGRSTVAVVPGQVLQGVETSMFDPIIEQVGLGPAERNHLGHTIAQVRETIDAVGPRVRHILATLEETADGLRETSDKIRPRVEGTAGRVESVARRLDEAKIEETLANVRALTKNVEGILAENRPVIQQTMAGVRDMTGTINDAITQERPKVDALLDGFNGTRVRLDGVLDQARVIAGQGAEIVTKNRSDLERTMINVKDTTDYGKKLVQKLYGNPFYLSPFYKPTRADVQAQEFYDVANTFMNGAVELNDAIKRIDALKAKPMTPGERQAFAKLYERAWTLNEELKQMATRLSAGINDRQTRR